MRGNRRERASLALMATAALPSAGYGIIVPEMYKDSVPVEARLTGPLRTLTTRWLAEGAVKVQVEPAGTPPPGLLDKPLFGTPEQRIFLARARAFVQFSATQANGVPNRAARTPRSG
jgi:hypothetical protein